MCMCVSLSGTMNARGKRGRHIIRLRYLTYVITRRCFPWVSDGNLCQCRQSRTGLSERPREMTDETKSKKNKGVLMQPFHVAGQSDCVSTHLVISAILYNYSIDNDRLTK